MDAADMVAGLRATFDAGHSKPLSWRLRQLAGLRELLTERSSALTSALRADLGKSTTESYATELSFVINEIDHTSRNLAKWLRPRRAALPAWMLPGRARVVQEPRGVVLIISPWNYPVQLSLAPLVGALAAGNCAVLKPSELAPVTSAALTRLLPLHVDADAVTVAQGGAPETTALLAEQFDHIFYTGNRTVGQIVMTAAARHLTPVTLELGGKSPAVVDEDVDLAITARRLAFGKFLNAGQTCVAPDYVLAIGTTTDVLEQQLTAAITEFYGPDPSTSGDYGRIVNERHFDRLVALLGAGRIVTGGEHDRARRYIAPTVLADVPTDAPVMQEEIFGPILPVVRVADLDEAIGFILARDRPLALYAFTESTATRRRLIAETSSGAIGFGLPAAHLAVATLPFGGVGESGMGAYHGQFSFETFSHRKAILDKPLRGPGPIDSAALAYPPYTAVKRTLLRRLL